MVYLFLADGFEIIEALSPVDMLRRADIDVKTVGVTGNVVTSSCGVKVNADISKDSVDLDNVDAVILPGGSLGTENLDKDSFVSQLVDDCAKKSVLICAICAAPSILGKKGLLKGIEATAFPSFTQYLDKAVLSNEPVVYDKNFITARGAGVSVEFGLKIVEVLKGRETADNIKRTIQCR